VEDLDRIALRIVQPDGRVVDGLTAVMVGHHLDPVLPVGQELDPVPVGIARLLPCPGVVDPTMHGLADLQDRFGGDISRDEVDDLAHLKQILAG
jgi:hypothetical protein